MVTPLSQTAREDVIRQAQAIAAQQGISPQQALWNYAQSQGLSASDVDTYMGLQPGETMNWAVLNGQAPAPQGNFNPSASAAIAQVAPPVQPSVVSASPPPSALTASVAPSPVTPTVQPLTAAERAEVVKQAETVAAQTPGMTPEQALYAYATANKISASDVDTYMGWPTGTTAGWAASNAKPPAPSASGSAAPAPSPVNQASAQPVAPAPIKSAAELAAAVAPGKAYALSPAERAQVTSLAQTTAQQQGITPERALYNYADTNKIGIQDLDTYMGWPSGTAQSWATNNIPGFVPPTTVAPQSPLITPPGPLTTLPTQPAPTPSTPYRPQYQMPTLNALYQNQQQRMTSEAPRFNFQSQQPGALTTVTGG